MKAYIIHVSDAYDRKVHIENELKNKELDTTYILEGDKKTLTEALIKKYFKGDMASVSNATSCALKHILAYKKMLNENKRFFLVFEDDIHFYPNFSDLKKIVYEIKERKLENFIISLEDSNLKFIPKSQRVKGKFLYPERKGRLAGAYLIDKKGVLSLLKFIDEEKIDLPIDWFHNKCIDKNVLNMFWSYPAIAVQGSLDGSIKSLIDNKKYGFFRIWSFKIQKVYKKILASLR